MFPPVRTFFSPHFTEKMQGGRLQTKVGKKPTICSLTGVQNLLIGVTKVNNQAKGEDDVKHPYMENL
jgi:hypothetical protein